jgi:hypothetical protein
MVLEFQEVQVVAVVINLLQVDPAHKHPVPADQQVMDFLVESVALLGQAVVVVVLAEPDKALAELCVIKILEKQTYQGVNLL